MSVPQGMFHDALLDSARAVPEGLSDGQGRPAGGRFSVYRNNVAVSLTEALETSFPAVRKLIGEENFRKVAGVFLRKHPPASPMLMRYGAAFPGFLEGFEPLRHLGYLPDVARLEQALRVSYHAADADPADAGILESLAPDALAGTRFTLAPAVILLHSSWPVHAIWAYNMEAGAPKPQGGAQNVLVTRPDYDPQPLPVMAGTAAFIAALQGGASLGDASDSAAGKDPDFDLSGALSLLLGARAISGISTGDFGP